MTARGGPGRRRRQAALVVVAMVVSGCVTPTVAVSGNNEPAPPLTTPTISPTSTSPIPTTPTPTFPTSTTPTPTTTAPSTTTTTTVPDQVTARVKPCDLSGDTPPPIHGDAIDASQAVLHALVCDTSDVVVAAPETGTDDALRAAIAMGVPLVYASADRPFDPGSLTPPRIWATNPALVAAGSSSVLPVPRLRGAVPALVASVVDSKVGESAVEAVARTTRDTPILAILSTSRSDLAASTATTAQAAGGEAIWAPPGDLRARPVLADALQGSSSRLLIGNFDADSAWEADVAAAGATLPGGGQILFPGKRIVTLYGNPTTPNLGVLGEQPPDEAVKRAAEVAAPYAGEGVTLVPGFDLIAAVASSVAGPDGNYSTEMTVDELRPWVEAATQAGYYLVLDLQPGRTDFLTQAKRYEEFLRLPNVGLALDPEWRLGPGQYHLRQTGTVDASEINQVVDWLATIVRQNLLPQKLLMVHQFKLSMITNRSDIETPPELAVVIQMDGQGPLPTKLATWRNLLSAGQGGWSWGWKNFYDEDDPMATPDQVLGLDPVPVFVSFQ